MAGKIKIIGKIWLLGNQPLTDTTERGGRVPTQVKGGETMVETFIEIVKFIYNAVIQFIQFIMNLPNLL